MKVYAEVDAKGYMIGEMFYALDDFKQRIEDGEKEILLGKGVMSIGLDCFFCDACGDTMTREVGQCGKACIDYEPRNGKSGRCKSHRNCYEVDGGIIKLTKNGMETQTGGLRKMAREVRFIFTGEFRPPKKGEWYLLADTPRDAKYDLYQDMPRMIMERKEIEVKEAE